MLDRRDFLKYSVLAVPGLSGFGKVFAQGRPLADYPIASVALRRFAQLVQAASKAA